MPCAFASKQRFCNFDVFEKLNIQMFFSVEEENWYELIWIFYLYLLLFKSILRDVMLCFLSLFSAFLDFHLFKNSCMHTDHHHHHHHKYTAELKPFPIPSITGYLELFFDMSFQQIFLSHLSILCRISFCFFYLFFKWRLSRFGTTL